MKQLLEKRSKLIEQIEAIMNVAETEKRAFSKEELDKINGYTDEVSQLMPQSKLKKKLEH